MGLSYEVQNSIESLEDSEDELDVSKCTKKRKVSDEKEEKVGRILEQLKKGMVILTPNFSCVSGVKCL